MVMVMETPNAQSVGREFVRQYYTMLNQAPIYVHRFYSSNSSYVHGGIDQPGKEVEPVYGQQEIHKKIVELDFRDCHAKIRQVDSHATISDGVVVQVTGELSNNGQPMRRFMQTFVLAPQSEKRYYVHNDIFRYQDEVFNDDEESEAQDGVPESEPEEEHGDVIENQDGGQDHSASPYFEQQTVSNGNVHLEELASAPVTSPPVDAVNQPLTNNTANVAHVGGGGGFHSQVNPSQQVQQQQQLMSEPEPQQSPPSQQNLVTVVPNSPVTKKNQRNSFADEKSSKSPEPLDDLSHSGFQSTATDTSSNEPKTYANMVSKNASGGGSAATWHNNISGNMSNMTNTPSNITNNTSKPSPGSGSQSLTNHHISSHNTNDSLKGGESMVSGGGTGGGMSGNGGGGGGFMTSGAPQPQRMQQRPRGNSMRGGVRDRGMRNSEDGGDGDRRRNNLHYPDALQLFVGNLTAEISEEELREHFNQYGAVQDLRINRMSTKPGAPNFGFVVFEDEATVQKVLNAKPIIFKGEHRLNVEEKKAKQRDGRMGGGDGRNNSGRGGLGGRMGGLGGPGRGGGGGRGGPSGGGNGGGGGMNRSENRGGGMGGRGRYNNQGGGVRRQ